MLRRDFIFATGASMLASSVHAQPIRVPWAESKGRRSEGYDLDLRETGAAFDDRSDDTEAIQDGINWVAGKGGGTCRLPWKTARVGRIVVPSSVIIEGAGGHVGVSVLRGTALSGPVVVMAGRSAGVRRARISSTPERLAAGALDGHGIHASFGDRPGLPTLSRLVLDDVFVTNQPADGIHISGQIEHSRFDTVTVADCRRHGFALDDGGRAGFKNLTYGFFVMEMARCRAIECGGNALLAGRRGQQFQPHNLILDQFEALGCCWDEARREIVQQVGLFNQQTILRQPDIEDQQYRESKTVSTGMSRIARSAPAEGILIASQGVDMQQPYFSGLSKSITVEPRTANIRIWQPKVNPGKFGKPQPVAITIGKGVVEFEVVGTTQPGAVELVRSESTLGVIRVDGVERRL